MDFKTGERWSDSVVVLVGLKLSRRHQLAFREKLICGTMSCAAWISVAGFLVRADGSLHAALLSLPQVPAPEVTQQ
jgi:hypothetical protein